MTRERWDKRKCFIMASIGSAIGLGNVWRFPYILYQNGGGAFLIPYFIALLTTGIPLMAFEYYLGARYQKGPSEAFGYLKKNTNFIGWFAVLVSFIITVYYTVVMGWAWNYMYYSLGVKWAGIEKEFFFNNILSISSGVDVLGSIQWPIMFGNLLTWTAIYFILYKGIKGVGKIVDWTVSLPWALLLILLIRGITLPGAMDGLNFYLYPDFKKLLNINVWLAAYGQVFFSLSLGFGVMVAYSSFLPKDSDINTNAWVVSFANCLTSFFAGFAVFSILGYLAVSIGQPVSEVAGAGPGLAFITFPTAIAKLPGGMIAQSIFGFLFFATLLTLGIDSAFSLVEAVVVSFSDTFKICKTKTLQYTCIIGFFLGTVFTMQGGLYWLDIVDRWMNSFGLIVVGFFEAMLIGWFVNTRKVEDDINSTSAIKFKWFWEFCVKWVSPIVLGIIIVFSFIKEFSHPYEGYKISALMMGGWFLVLSLFYLSLFLQKRHEFVSKIKNPFKVVGYLFIYFGLFYQIYQSYVSADKVFNIIMCLVVAGVGVFIAKYIGDKKQAQIDQENIFEEEGE